MNSYGLIIAFILGGSLVLNACAIGYIWRTDSAKVVVPYEVMRGVK